MTSAAWGALLTLFFAPLSFIYGRSLAGRIQARAAERGRPALGLMVPKLVLPILVAGALGLRFSGTIPENWPITVPSATMRAAMAALWTLGSVAGILFFLAIPFVLGRLFAAAAVALGWFADVRDEPLRFGTSGYKNGKGEREADTREADTREANRREADFREASRRVADEGDGNV